LEQLVTQHPNRLGFLVWDTHRIRQLEAALNQVIANDPEGIVPPPQLALLRRSLIHRLTGLGPLDPLLLDDTITEILANGVDIFIERHGTVVRGAWEVDDCDQVEDLARRLASRAGRSLTSETPVCDARLADGSRVHCVLPPLSEVPTICIRRAPRTAWTVAQFVDLQFMSEPLWEQLATWVQQRRNMIIAGGASTGKTSFLRLLATNIPETERLVTIEDVRELNLDHPNIVRLEAHRQYTVQDLVKHALRMRPDRIIVGEVRGQEAWDLIDSMGSGHPGSLCTVHSTDAGIQTINRLARMALQKSLTVSFPDIVAQILETVDVLIYLTREANGHRHIGAVTEIHQGHFVPRWRWRADSAHPFEEVGSP
jgi:pilus assembly protein CpaF